MTSSAAIAVPVAAACSGATSPDPSSAAIGATPQVVAPPTDASGSPVDATASYPFAHPVDVTQRTGGDSP